MTACYEALCSVAEFGRCAAHRPCRQAAQPEPLRPPTHPPHPTPPPTYTHPSSPPAPCPQAASNVLQGDYKEDLTLEEVGGWAGLPGMKHAACVVLVSPQHVGLPPARGRGRESMLGRGWGGGGCSRGPIRGGPYGPRIRSPTEAQRHACCAPPSPPHHHHTTHTHTHTHAGHQAGDQGAVQDDGQHHAEPREGGAGDAEQGRGDGQGARLRLRLPSLTSERLLCRPACSPWPRIGARPCRMRGAASLASAAVPSEAALATTHSPHLPPPPFNRSSTRCLSRRS